MPGIFHQCHLQQAQEFGRVGGARPPGRLPPLPPLRLLRPRGGRRRRRPRGEVTPGHRGTTQRVHLLQPTAAFPDTSINRLIMCISYIYVYIYIYIIQYHMIIYTYNYVYIYIYIYVCQLEQDMCPDLWTLAISFFRFRFGILCNLLLIHCHHMRFLDILGQSKATWSGKSNMFDVLFEYES